MAISSSNVTCISGKTLEKAAGELLPVLVTPKRDPTPTIFSSRAH